MTSHSIGPSDKMGSSEKHFAHEKREMVDQNTRLFQGKNASRELLMLQQAFARGKPPTPAGEALKANAAATVAGPPPGLRGLNPLFRVHRYPPDYRGLAGKKLTPEEK